MGARRTVRSTVLQEVKKNKVVLKGNRLKELFWSFMKLVDFHVLFSNSLWSTCIPHPHPFFSSKIVVIACPGRKSSAPGMESRLQNVSKTDTLPLVFSPGVLLHSKHCFFYVFWTLHLSVRPSTSTVGFSRFPHCTIPFWFGVRSVFQRLQGVRKRHNYLLNLCCSSRCLLPFVASSGKSCPVSYTTSQLLDWQRTYGERKV